MAVPKKKTSKSRRRIRRYSWNNRISKDFLWANSLKKSISQVNSKSFLI